MTILDWLHGSIIKLRDAGVDSPRRDCMVLVEDLLGKDRSWVNAHAEHELSKDEVEKLNQQIARRIGREPLAYIRDKVAFYKRFFTVSPDVLIPRPESESFVEILKEIKPKTIADIGTGSGCLAITAKLELPELEVLATDTSPKALEIARQNAKKHSAGVKFAEGSLLKPLETLNFWPEAILANLPYVPEGLITSPEITTEPQDALFSGKDGLKHYKGFWQQTAKLSKKPKYILTEALENQHGEVSKLAKAAGYNLQKTDVLTQLFQRS